jgi:peptidoglycan/xylan/chitin deacetylase (PgdA/CDA1 family)
MLWKKVARIALHRMGGLAVLRAQHRREFGVLMFHLFSEQTRANVEAFCEHITRNFEPVSLSAIVDALEGRKSLPDNALAVTVDDGYRSFIQHGHPVFLKHGVPVTLYAVAGFSEGSLWLWPDQISFGLQNSTRGVIRAPIGDDKVLELPLGTSQEKTDAIFLLTENLKVTSNERRLDFLAKFGGICGVEIPVHPPSDCEAMNWEELRAVASDGVEIGCHTETHPILSRLSDPLELEREIRGAKEHLEERLGFPVRHFCYPNGRAIDIGDAAIRCVRDAGFASAVTCVLGLNTTRVDRLGIQRIPFGNAIDFDYGAELLAGLHM